MATPHPIFAWHRTFATQQCDGSKPHTSVGRPRMDQGLEALVVRLGYRISDQMVRNILKRQASPGPRAQDDPDLARVHSYP